MSTLYSIIDSISAVSFRSWLSQFPSLIYTTVYIGDIFRSTHGDSKTDEGTRAGSRAMLYEAIVGLVVIIIVPAFLEAKTWGIRALWGNQSPRVFLSVAWAASQLVSAFLMLSISLVVNRCQAVISVLTRCSFPIVESRVQFMQPRCLSR